MRGAFKTTPERSPPPATLGELEAGDRLVVAGLRLWLCGLAGNVGGYWSHLWNDCARRFGAEDGKVAVHAFACLVREIRDHARRRFRHHQPCCGQLTPDELCLVCLVGACQRREPALAEGLARWLVRADGSARLREAAERLAGVLERHGLRLPPRHAWDAPGRPPALGASPPGAGASSSRSGVGHPAAAE